MKSAGDEKILTIHPQGKTGVRISRNKYDVLRQAIIKIVKKERDISFQELGDAVEATLKNNFDGSVMWYFAHVKLDLEARKIIRRVQCPGPQRICLGKKTK
ncbi:hypothetical protein JNM05_11800 [bacterium]|nr:hypothetical protein [bacterium]